MKKLYLILFTFFLNSVVASDYRKNTLPSSRTASPDPLSMFGSGYMFNGPSNPVFKKLINTPSITQFAFLAPKGSPIAEKFSDLALPVSLPQDNENSPQVLFIMNKDLIFERIEKLQEDVFGLKKELESKGTDLESLQRSNDKKSKDYELLKNQNKATIEEWRKKNQELMEKEKEIQILTRTIQTGQEANEALKAQNKRLANAQLTALEETFEDIHNHNQQITNLIRHVDELNTTNTRLVANYEQLLKKTDSDKKEIIELNKLVDELSLANGALENSLKQKPKGGNQTIKTKPNLQSQTVQTDGPTVQELEEQLEYLKKKKKVHDTELASKIKTITSLNESIEIINQQKSALEEQIQTKNAKIAQLNAEIIQKDSSNKDLLQQLRFEKTANQALKKQVENLEAQLTKAQSEYIQANQTVIQINQNHSEALQKLARKSAEALQKLQRKIIFEKAANLALQKQLDKKQLENNSAWGTVSALYQTAGDYSKTIKEQKQTIKLQKYGLWFGLPAAFGLGILGTKYGPTLLQKTYLTAFAFKNTSIKVGSSLLGAISQKFFGRFA